jgi:hypothetical protein
MVTGSMWRICKNRLVLAALAGTLVWFADQPTVTGYNPLLQMFWDPGIWRTPAHDREVLLLSWLVTTLFCHFVLFAFQKARHRTGGKDGAQRHGQMGMSSSARFLINPWKFR